MPVHVTSQLSAPSQTHEVSSGAHDFFVVATAGPASPDEEDVDDELDEHAATIARKKKAASGFMAPR